MKLKTRDLVEKVHGLYRRRDELLSARKAGVDLPVGDEARARIERIVRDEVALQIEEIDAELFDNGFDPGQVVEGSVHAD